MELELEVSIDVFSGNGGQLLRRNHQALLMEPAFLAHPGQDDEIRCRSGSEAQLSHRDSRARTGRINAKGLLVSKTGPAAVRPERVQLLLTTIALSAKYLSDVSQARDGNFPSLDSTWYYVFGSSSAVYLSRKIYERYLQSKLNK